MTYTLDRIFEPDSGRTTYNLKVLDSWTAVDEYTVDLHHRRALQRYAHPSL